MGRRRRVNVPGSSANLGPGFDTLAAAVSAYLELEVEETGSFAVETDVAGRPVPIQTRLVPADDSADRATLLVVLPRNMQQELCGRELLDKAIMTGAPIKLTVRDQTSGLMLQAPIPVGWCAG